MRAALLGLLSIGTPACGSSDSGAAKMVPPGGAVVTSSTVDDAMTLEKFTAECTSRNGTLEIHSHCGGANSCSGMSYDTGTHVLTEHTCSGLNTCAGYSCIVPG